MKKIKNAVAVVIFVSAFLCACHENYSTTSHAPEVTDVSSEYSTGTSDQQV